MSIAREGQVGRSEYWSLGTQKLEKIWFPVSLTDWWGNRHEYK